jgi:pimeloyl-ACP methyl ester carboxylesterase/predicted glycosyltransferase
VIHRELFGVEGGGGMRARYPDHEGFVERDGVKVAYEVYGEGPRTVVMPALDTIVHSRAWKAQIPFLSRLARVVTIDPRGNGRSDRPLDPAAYSDTSKVADTIAVMDEVGVDKAVLLGLCTSSWTALKTAADHPDRVLGVASIATWAPYLSDPYPWRMEFSWEDELDTDEGWAKDNKHYWLRDYRGYVEFFFSQLLVEAHSTKQWEDCVSWALETTAEVMIANDEGPLSVSDREGTEAALRSVRCPVVAIHGDGDRCQPFDRSARTAELTGGRLVTLEGAGHLPHARHPVVVNQILRDFLDEVAPAPAPSVRWRIVANRRPRALFLSSPIGLGHARRDVAIAEALREIRPEVEIDWLAQHPVTEVLSRSGEHIHPASAWLASESQHVESECGEHDLHAFQAVRRMDEILVNNFMVFDDVVREESYDLVVGDEAWDVDHFLHENPELKRSALVWLTDFVGWLPFADGGDQEAELTRDYNAEMVELVARTPRLRDRSIFVGEPGDLVADSLGEGLPTIREWTESHYEFSGYISGFEPVPEQDRMGVRAELGYHPDEQVCIVTVGGSGVGSDLLRRVMGSYREASRLVPGLRMVVVTGPRIDPESLTGGRPTPPGLEMRPYVHDLWRHLSVCDLAVVQGGLTTTMELTASRRPFLYVPLRHHFEQQFHVRHRLDRYRAGRHVDYTETEPDLLAGLIAAEIGRPVDYLPVAGDGHRLAAARLSELL